MVLKQWINPLLVGLLILFSMPLKLPALQQMLESLLSFSFPIRLSLYTLFLPPVALFCIVWNRKRTLEMAKTPTAFNRTGFPFFLDVAGCNCEWVSENRTQAFRTLFDLSVDLSGISVCHWAEFIEKKRTNFYWNLCDVDGFYFFGFAWPNEHSWIA